MTYTIDDLPKYSHWPEKLLGLKEFNPKQKTLEELDREYEKEKWGALLSEVLDSDKPPTLELAETLLTPSETKVFYYQKKSFDYAYYTAAHLKYIRLVEGFIGKYITECSALFELGSGYGSIILKLAKKSLFSKVPLFAADFSESALKLLQMIALEEKIKIQTASCNFLDHKLTNIVLPTGSLIFTSFALTCIPQLEDTILENMINLKPKFVVHFEPFYEHQEDTSLFGLLNKKYIQLNNYNKNLLNLLKNAQEKGKITIIEEDRNCFGINPLLCGSVLVWSPVV